jgi:antitoxin (DNA-binding transcriptional repressor) of toxin-antitoxin stability system
MADVDPAIKTVGVRELRDNLSAFLREAQQGRSFQVVSRGKVLAKIGPAEEAVKKPRRLGTLRGKIWVAPDFDEWPEDILQSFEADL